MAKAAGSAEFSPPDKFPTPENPCLAALSRVMGKIGSIGKDGTNDGEDGWKYMTIEALDEKLQPLFSEEGLLVVQSEVETNPYSFWANDSELAIQYRFVFWHKSGVVMPTLDGSQDGSPILHTGTCSLYDSNGDVDDKAANKCHAAARKYFIRALFQIPTKNTPDADKSAPRASRPAGRKQNAAVAETKPAQTPAEWEAPKTIPYEGDGIVKWATRFAAHLNAAKKTLEIEDWWLRNDATLSDMVGTAPRTHDRLATLTEELKTKLDATRAAS